MLHQLWDILETKNLQEHMTFGYFCKRFQGDERQAEPEQPILMQQLQRMKLLVTPDTPAIFLTAAITVNRSSHPVINIDNNEIE